MDLHELTQAISDDMGLSRVIVERVVRYQIKVITRTVAKGEIVHLREFGRFFGKKRAARQARHPKTGLMIRIAATTIPGFEAAHKLKVAVAAKKPGEGRAVPAPASPKAAEPIPAVPKKS